MTPTPAPAPTPAKKKRRDCLNVTLRVHIPIVDRSSLDLAYQASDDAKAATSWPAGSVITATTSLGKA